MAYDHRSEAWYLFFIMTIKNLQHLSENNTYTMNAITMRKNGRNTRVWTLGLSANLCLYKSDCDT